jgi:hypothetical protein
LTGGNVKFDKITCITPISKDDNHGERLKEFVTKYFNEYRKTILEDRQGQEIYFAFDYTRRFAVRDTRSNLGNLEDLKCWFFKTQKQVEEHAKFIKAFIPEFSVYEFGKDISNKIK